MKMQRAIFALSVAVCVSACSAVPAKSPLQGAAPPKHPPPFSQESQPPVSKQAEAVASESAVTKTIDIYPDGNRPGEDVKGKRKTGPLPRISGTLTTGLIGPTKPEPLPGSAIPNKDKQKIVLNFDKADIAEVTNQIFGDYLKLNYVLDPALQGRISLYLEGEYSKEELFQLISKVYEANNVSVVPRKGIYYIQPVQRSASSSLPLAGARTLGDEKTGARPVAVIYRLRYMDAKQAINLVQPFLSPGRTIKSDNLTNSLLFVENAENSQTIVEVLKALDINVLQEVSMEIVPVRSISPDEAVQSLESLMGKMGSVKESAIKNNLAYIPLHSFGGVLILSQTPELLKTAKQWLTALDVHSAESGENIHVYFVQNGLARDISDILNQVFGLGGTGGGRLDQQIVSSIRQPSSSWGARPFGGSAFGTGRSSFGGSSSFGSRSATGTGTFGTSAAGASGVGALGGVGTGTGTTGTTRSDRLQRRGTAGGVIGGVGTTGVTSGAAALGLTGEVMIIPDEVNNAIIVRANLMDWAKIKKTVETLDIVPRAVLIEVTVAEITLTKDFQFGVQWFFKDTGVASGEMSGAHRVTNGLPITFADRSARAVGAAVAGGLGLGWISNVGDIGVLLQALSNKTKVNILSTPTLLATDNQEASITVGGREPVPTGTAIGAAGTTDAVISSIQYEETGVILNVTPHINAGGLVRMDLEQTIRNVDNRNVTVGNNNTAPSFSERNIRTTLLAQDGSTVVIGGIIQNRGSDNKTGIPGVQDLPLIAPLFSTKNTTLNRTELIIAITPHVIDQRENVATREFLNRMRDLRKRADRGKTF